MLLEVVAAFGVLVYGLASITRSISALKVGVFSTCTILPGQAAFRLLTCIERYLAVVPPSPTCASGKKEASGSGTEAVIWMAVHHTQKKALEVFAREVAPAGTGMAPGLTGIVGGRPRVSPVLKPFFFMHPKSELKEAESIQEAEPHTSEQEVPPPSAQEEPDAELPSGPHSFRLEELAFTRSGDKGDSANIGVIARHPLFFPYLKKHLTSSVVEDYFSHLITPGTKDAVTRYTLPGINGLNFVLQSSLGGGGVASLRSDPQGKAYGQMLLDLKLRNLPDLKSL
ncbi:hypothetical protein JOQ06_012979, partial [Pogonophryne albipinna]